MKLFYCYSNKLKNELLENGYRYLHSGVHNKTKKTFWVYEGNEELNQFLKSRIKY